jgi:hypothetical protein
MSRLENLVREALNAHDAQAPDGATLLRDVRSRAAYGRRRRARWVVTGLTAAVLAGVAVTLFAVQATGGSNHRSVPLGIATKPAVAPSSVTYPLPSDGWKPGDASLQALASGPFHATRRDGHVCAWVGADFHTMLWPANYSVRLRPVELIAPDGTVVAREGQTVNAGGGGGPTKAGTACAQKGQQTFYVNGSPTGPAPTGTIQGRLLAVGGPGGAPPEPLAGQVTVTGKGASHTVRTGTAGAYSIQLQPGTYTVTGRSSQYKIDGQDGKCAPSHSKITITAERDAVTDILCQER